MKFAFDLDKKLEAFAKQAEDNSRALREAVRANAIDACAEMEAAAKAHTPHKDDGKPRGFNVISNALQDSWIAKYEPGTEKEIVGTVILENTKPYAIYVQNGHRVSKHFVPWLYIDGDGELSYATNHSQKMFGLVVGTKTPYVKGVDMVGPAIKAFNETFDALMEKTMEKILHGGVK